LGPGSYEADCAGCFVRSAIWTNRNIIGCDHRAGTLARPIRNETAGFRKVRDIFIPDVYIERLPCGRNFR
jgi:hypothetical protein